jgi:RNA polymerase sigma-70 factor, ECF subfamily
MTNADSFRDSLVTNIPSLRSYARAITRNPDRADDLVHDTIVRALASEHQFVPGTNLRAWLMTILRNHYINALRRRKFEAEPLSDDARSELPTPASQMPSVALMEVRRRMEQLSEDHRAVLVLVGAAGYSYEEAADVCGCAVGTVKSRLSRARRELAAMMATPLNHAPIARVAS